jgi:DnaK suppressor protein
MTGIAEHTTATVRGQALSARQRATMRSHLGADRERTRDLIERLMLEMDAFVDARRDVTTDDEHDPEGPTMAFERSQSSAMLAQAKQHVFEIDAALSRLDAGTFGICVTCGDAIALGRLQVRPQAKLCIRCAEHVR